MLLTRESHGLQAVALSRRAKHALPPNPRNASSRSTLLISSCPRLISSDHPSSYLLHMPQNSLESPSLVLDQSSPSIKLIPRAQRPDLEVDLARSAQTLASHLRHLPTTICRQRRRHVAMIELGVLERKTEPVVRVAVFRRRGFLAGFDQNDRGTRCCVGEAGGYEAAGCAALGAPFGSVVDWKVEIPM